MPREPIWNADPELKAEAEVEQKKHRRSRQPNGPDYGGKPNGAGRVLWIDDGDWNEAQLPQRPWVAPGYALRGAVTLVVGPPSAMKSSLMLAWAISAVLGKSHGNFRPCGPCCVINYNVEEGCDEQRRRASAALKHFGAKPNDLEDRLIRTGPDGIGTLFTFDAENSVVINTAAMAELRALIEDRRPDIFIADPFAELHTAAESDNTALRAIVAVLRALAIEFNMAVILVHHTRKGVIAPGDVDIARGGSAIIGASRIVLTLLTMPQEDAERFGLDTDRKSRSAYMRLDDAKQNYAAIADAQWYERTPFTLANGEVVPAAVPWKPPDAWADLSVSLSNAILNEIDAGIDGGTRRYTHVSAAADRAAWKVVTRHASLAEKQARLIVNTWVKNGVLDSREYDDPVDRKSRRGLFLNDARRPGTWH